MSTINGMDQNDYTELFIRHLVHDRVVFNKAKQYDICGDDFVVNELYGEQLYKEFIDSIMTTDVCPLGIDILGAKLTQKFQDGKISQGKFDDALALLNYLYTDGSSLTSKFFEDTLRTFIEEKRTSKAIFELKDNPEELKNKLNSLAIDLSADDIMAKTVDAHPFAAPIFKQKQELIGTSISVIDERINGLGLGEFGIVVGYSGGGKTVFGTNIVLGNAIVGVPSQFISLEENEVQISQRFYANFFDIPYTDLHKGVANLQLEEEFRNHLNDSRRITLAENLSLIGLKGLTPITADQLYEVMVRKYEKTGFIPQNVVIDQLQFVEPSTNRKGLQAWEREKASAAELDELSHKKIGGHNFALWVLHQAKGKLKRHFSRDEIDGFKGIIHKADLVLGLGRDNEKSTEADVFSLKVRHCADFMTTLTTDFKYMRFVNRAAGSNMAMEGYAQATANPIDSGPPPLPDSLIPVGNP